MLTYTPVSEAGGVGKTTTAATLAASHARAGHDVLAIDMDTQNGSLTYLFGPDYDRGSGDVDNLVRHLVGRPKGSFEDLTYEVEEGIDLVPSHNMLEDLHEFLLNEKNQAERLGESFSMYHQLHRVLKEANVRDETTIAGSGGVDARTQLPRTRVTRGDMVYSDRNSRTNPGAMSAPWTSSVSRDPKPNRRAPSPPPRSPSVIAAKP